MDKLSYKLVLDTRAWVCFKFDLEALVLCTQYDSPHDPKYASYLMYIYKLDPKVVISEEEEEEKGCSKKEDVCHVLFESSSQVFCRHLGMIQQKGADLCEEGHCFNRDLCAEILVQHILVDAITTISAHADNILLPLEASTFGELHKKVSESQNPSYKTYVLTLETAGELYLSQDDIHVCEKPLLKLYRCHWMCPGFRLLIINQELLQSEKRRQLLELLPCGKLLVLLQNEIPKHLHAEPKIKVTETKTGTEYAVGLTWRGIYVMETPSLWIELS